MNPAQAPSEKTASTLDRLEREIWAFWPAIDKRSWNEVKASDPVWTERVHWVARSLLGALREPSQDMVRAGIAALKFDDQWQLEDGWRAMIDRLIEQAR